MIVDKSDVLRKLLDDMFLSSRDAVQGEFTYFILPEGYTERILYKLFVSRICVDEEPEAALDDMIAVTVRAVARSFPDSHKQMVVWRSPAEALIEKNYEENKWEIRTRVRVLALAEGTQL
mgnify:CR=1 FL=1|tara:strand:+ start:186 stop:545 length:360 start_codon:yes stop_codon:yes gene_type:complete